MDSQSTKEMPQAPVTNESQAVKVIYKAHELPEPKSGLNTNGKLPVSKLTLSQGKLVNNKPNTVTVRTQSDKRSIVRANGKHTRNQSTNTPRHFASMKSIRSSTTTHKIIKRKSVQRTSEGNTGNTVRRYFASVSKSIDIAANTSKVCDAQHDGRVMMRQSFGIQVDAVFNLLFSSTSEFLRRFHASRKSVDLILGKWKQNGDGTQVRMVNVTMALQANVGPKTSKVTEMHTLRTCSVPGELYAIDVETVTAGIPYADVFNISTHYCLSRLSNNNTELLVLCNVNFIKSTWAVVRAFIMKHSYEGLSDFFEALTKELHQEATKRERKSDSQSK